MIENTATDYEKMAKRNLANAVSTKVAEGYRCESQTDSMATMVKGSKPNNTLHLILTLVTFGFWLFVWIPVLLLQKERRVVLQTDDFGNVLNQQI